MIGTFFNLCRACPSSMPLDKLHSEYRSTYRWHEYTAGPEVVRKPPMPNHFIINAPINEPPLPRRKKCPELAYRHHEFIADSNADRTDSNVTRARAGESSGIFRKTISKLSTEYRLQFVWPSVRKVTGPSNKDKDNQILLEPPKKSQSMGALKSSQTNTLAGIHKKRTTNEEKEGAT